ncbi:DUF4314 domain-containing protein [Gemmata algarum]|uniref:DUF4314 domain-containing protein n=1 Tax=Gemmata algarum TaxID=2975278 RepID=UPI0039C9C3C5
MRPSVVATPRSPSLSVGDRVRLIEIRGETNLVPPGMMGTVWLVDALGTAHVWWDDGSDLGLVPERDRYELVVRSE